MKLDKRISNEDGLNYFSLVGLRIFSNPKIVRSVGKK